MNWGNKLILVFVAFAGLIGYMVYRCMHVPVSLVAKEYYKDELAYQEVIDGKTASAALSSPVKLAQDKEVITLQWPAEMKDKQVSGTVLFYYAADANRDREFPVAMNAAAQQAISAKTFLPGMYTVKINWEADKQHYYSEAIFNVQ